MSWDSWLRAWEAHAKTSAHKRRLDVAVAEVQRLSTARLFCAISGGKDGVAMTGVCAMAGRTDLPTVHVYTPANTPGMEETARETAKRLGMSIAVIEPDLDDFWAWLAGIPGSIADRSGYQIMCRKIAAGNMLVAYTYEQKFDGAINGMRTEESKGRLWNRKMRGRTYHLKIDGKMMCQPIVDWEARDVFAFCVSQNLPICDHYRLLYERFDVSPESPNSRVDCLITNETLAATGTVEHARALYPDLWRQIERARPELRMLY